MSLVKTGKTKSCFFCCKQQRWPQGWEETVAPTTHCLPWPLLINFLFFCYGYSIFYWFQLDSSTVTMAMAQIFVSFGLPSSYWKVTRGDCESLFYFSRTLQNLFLVSFFLSHFTYIFSCNFLVNCSFFTQPSQHSLGCFIFFLSDLSVNLLMD